ncbi:MULTISPECIES: CaiB/BaiF CoA transferase family protein [Ramlibacter]|uniref:CoA transferase n=1 Tax=Ramlibacter pinisoli TaxID=2682844 RepID=A0A6N8J0E5_9BURK|nr:MULTISPECIES: CoA transferase [Ramlibacter]MBA2962373.1 CoA transferase [Ramlibacter sp. CGMCC 1.13660]MVQ32315.1 CoA transferase [Ramlibacter pinisoli]
MRTSTSASPLAALDGIRVIEIGTFISAPFAATLLADFGAEVIKLELPDGGDPMRTLGEYPPGGDSSYWWSAMGRNKRSVALDVRTPQGRDILGRLLEKADVLVENFRPGTLDRWGITREWLREKSPDLVIARISGYGQDGPWRDVPGFDRNAQAFSGLVYVTGEPDMPPQQAGLPVCDFNAGLWSAFGIVTALLGQLRHRQPGGNEIDLALYETMLPFLKDMPQRFRHQGRVTQRTGNTPDYVSPGGSYRTGSGEWIFISGTGDTVFRRLMHAVGRPDMAESEQFRQNKDRVAHRPLLDGAINQWLLARNTDDALAQLQAADVPAVKIQSIEDVMTHPQVLARGNFLDVPDHGEGDVCMPAPLPRMAGMPAAVRWPGEHLGESTRRVLREELGVGEEEFARLQALKVIGS